MFRLTIACIPVIALLACGSGGKRAGGSTGPASAQAMDKSISLPTGVTLRYREAGTPGGEVVLFLHGYTDTRQSFLPTVERLLELRPDLHVYVLDQRGHGGSSMPPAKQCAPAPEQCFRVLDFAADAIAFLDAMHVERATVVGHSMGSMVAQEMALGHPDRVHRLVLIGTTANATGNAALRDFVLGQMIEGKWRPALEARGKRFPDDFYQLTPADADPDAASWLAANWVTEPAAEPSFLATMQPADIKLGTWIGAARALLEFDTRKRLEHIKVPVLVLWGSQDALLPESPDQRELLAALGVATERYGTAYRFKQYGVRPLPADMGQLDDIGHNLHWGAADPVARDIASFLLSGEPTRDRVSANPDDPRTLRIEPEQAVIRPNPSR